MLNLKVNLSSISELLVCFNVVLVSLLVTEGDRCVLLTKKGKMQANISAEDKN